MRRAVLPALALSPVRASVQALVRCRRGAAAVEFAFLGPLALAMLFTAIEGGRIYWMKQTLDEVAYATARCISVSSSCDTEDNQKAYAVDRAGDYAIKLSTSDVTVTPATTCRSIADANMVTITRTVDSPLEGLIPYLPTVVSTTACFPVVT